LIIQVQTKKSRKPGNLSTLRALDPLLCVLSFRIVCLYQLSKYLFYFSNKKKSEAWQS